MNTRTYIITLLAAFSALTARGQWLPVDSGTTANLHGVYFVDPGVAYAVGDGGTILKSNDAGATWSALSSGTTRALYDTYFFDANTGLAVGDNGAILRTTDGGSSWQSVSSGLRDSIRSISFNGANGICGAISQDIIYSSDSGASWQKAQSGFFGGGFFGAHMLSPTVGHVAGQNSIFQPMVGTTVDSGASWTFHIFYFNSNEGSCDDVFFFDENNGVTSGVVWDGEGAISNTSDAAADWTSTLFPQALQGMDFPVSNIGYVTGWLGTIMKSTDAGTTWTPQASGTSVNLSDVHFANDGLTGVVVGDGGTILRTTNGGAQGSLTFDSAFSAKGPFQIELPLDGSGIEDRTGGPNNKYSIYFAFNNPLASVASATTSCGAVANVAVDQAAANQVVVTVTGVSCNATNITVTVNGLVDEQGNTLPSVSISFGLLVGDVNGDGKVDHADYRIVKENQGQQVDETNFRSDVATAGHDTTGYINASDARLVRRQQGTHL